MSFGVLALVSAAVVSVVMDGSAPAAQFASLEPAATGTATPADTKTPEALAPRALLDTAPVSGSSEGADDGPAIQESASQAGGPGAETSIGLAFEANQAELTAPTPVLPTATPVPPTPTAEPPTPQPPTAATVVPPTPVPPTTTPVPPTATAVLIPATPTQTLVQATATPTTAPLPPAATLSGLESQMYALHNQQRASNGLPALALDATLVAAARQRAEDMASRGYFAHTSPTGETAFSAIDGYGYVYAIAGENIARNNYPQSQSVGVAMDGFMNSPGHRANILEGQFTKVGIGVATDGSGLIYYAVVFAG